MNKNISLLMLIVWLSLVSACTFSDIHWESTKTSSSPHSIEDCASQMNSLGGRWKKFESSIESMVVDPSNANIRMARYKTFFEGSYQNKFHTVSIGILQESTDIGELIPFILGTFNPDDNSEILYPQFINIGNSMNEFCFRNPAKGNDQSISTFCSIQIRYEKVTVELNFSGFTNHGKVEFDSNTLENIINPVLKNVDSCLYSLGKN